MKPSRPATPGVRLVASALFVFALSLTHAARAQSPTPEAAFLSALEREIFQEMNAARTRPQEYAALLEQLRPHFKGNVYQPPGRPAFVTQEGARALDDAIAFLRRARPVAALGVSKGMCLGANVHVKDQGPKGLTGHKGTDGSLCEQRLGRFGNPVGGVGENLSFGNDTARERVINLLIDDGVANRGHRQRLLSPDFKVGGVSCGDHSQFGTMCVITLAGGFNDVAATPAADGQAPARHATRF